jgi:hypothetical protein
MMRSLLSFFSLLAFGVMAATVIVAIMPWLSGRTTGDAVVAGPATLHFESLLLGVVLGLFLGTLTRLNWSDIPRRIVTWFMVREREFFYYALILGCLAVLLFY